MNPRCRSSVGLFFNFELDDIDETTTGHIRINTNKNTKKKIVDVGNETVHKHYSGLSSTNAIESKAVSLYRYSVCTTSQQVFVFGLLYSTVD
jgi:hypothetical protein